MKDKYNKAMIKGKLSPSRIDLERIKSNNAFFVFFLNCQFLTMI